MEIRYNKDLYEVFDDPDVSTIINLKNLEWSGHLERISRKEFPNAHVRKNLGQTI